MLAHELVEVPLSPPDELLSLGFVMITTNIKLVQTTAGGGGGYFGFQVTGMIKGYFEGLKFSIPRFLWVGKFGKYFLG